MKIAMVAGPGGLEPQVAELSAALARECHEVTVYCCADGSGGVQRAATPPGCIVVEMPEPLGESARRLDYRWTVDRPDIAHAHLWTAGIAAQLAADAQGVPTVATLATAGVAERDHLKMARLVARHADWVTATCTEEVSELIRLGRPRARISVVPGGVDLCAFSLVAPDIARWRWGNCRATVGSRIGALTLSGVGRPARGRRPSVAHRGVRPIGVGRIAALG